MPWATEVGCRLTENTQKENIESSYRGPSNFYTDRTQRAANIMYCNKFVGTISYDHM